MNHCLQNIHAVVTQMHGQRALVLWRILTGCTILAQLFAAFPQRHFLFGPNGVYPPDIAERMSMFGLFSRVHGPLEFEALYAAAIVAAIVWTLGFALPWSSLATLVLWRSMLDRLPGLGNGGDNLTQLLIIYSLFCNLKGPRGEQWGRRLPSWGRSLRAMVHNAGLAAFWLQICLVYFVAGAAKLHGEAWRNGTAIYYALSTDVYTVDYIAPLFEWPVVLCALAYATVVFQVGFPFLVSLNRYSRRVALVVALGFHMGIAVVMGMPSFALFMIAADLTFLRDEEVSSILQRGARLRLRLEDMFERRKNKTKKAP